MPAGKLDIYGLGQGGVNVDANPTQLKDDEARKLQNAVLDTDEAQGGLRKRGGLLRFNSTTLGGAIYGGISVPLPDPGLVTTTLYASLGTATSNTWATSSDGITWTAGTTPSVRAVGQTNRTIGINAHTCVMFPNSFRNALYYPSDSYTVGTSDPSIQVWDGVTEYTLTYIPDSPIDGDESQFISGMTVHNGEIYVAVNDIGGVIPDKRGRVFHLDYQTGSLTQIGESFSSVTGDIANGYPHTLFSFMGQLWTLADGLSGTPANVKVLRIRPFDETTWTVDSTTGLAAYGFSGAAFKGNLYIGCEDADASAALLKKRTPAGVYSTVDTGVDGGASFDRYDSLIVHDGALYANYFSIGQTSAIMRSTDGTTWTVDYDIEAQLGTTALLPGGCMSYGGALYFVLAPDVQTATTGQIIRRTAAGSWSSVYTGNLTGFIGWVKVQT